jgi:hypothetical protein
MRLRQSLTIIVIRRNRLNESVNLKDRGKTSFSEHDYDKNITVQNLETKCNN